MSDPARPPIYTHTRILQIIPPAPPTWIVYYFPDDGGDPLEAAPVLCWALVEEWQSLDGRASSPRSRDDRRHESYQSVRPMAALDQKWLDVDDSDNIVLFTTEWPLPVAQRDSLLASLAKQARAK